MKVRRGKKIKKSPKGDAESQRAQPREGAGGHLQLPRITVIVLIL